MSDPQVPAGLWSEARDPQATRDLYDSWAERYDLDMKAGGMRAQARLTALVERLLPDRAAPILDFGCGTGLMGEALAEAGYAAVHGTDISEGMLAVARAKGVYAALHLADPVAPPTVPPGTRAVICAGSVCVGAGPPALLGQLAATMEPGALLMLTYNDDTLRDAGYMEALTALQVDGTLRLDHAEYGEQLPALGRGATIYALTRL
jgi:predicted TPR repeat methyltransferase